VNMTSDLAAIVASAAAHKNMGSVQT